MNANRGDCDYHQELIERTLMREKEMAKTVREIELSKPWRPSPEQVNGAVWLILEHQKLVSPDERREIWASLMEGYCSACGEIDPDQNCQCQNDE